MSGDDYVYDEASGEWVLASEAAVETATVEVRGAGGNLLADGDQEIDCRHEGIKGLVLRAEFVRKR